MLIKDLIDVLSRRNPNAQVLLMTQRKQPFENHLAGVVAREDMADQNGRAEPGIAQDDVFLVVGKRIRPGSLSAWILSEQSSDFTPGLPVTEPAAGQHLPVETTESRADALTGQPPFSMSMQDD